MLFIGCEIPDWIGRFLLRMSSNERLSAERKQFFFVGSSNSQVNRRCRISSQPIVVSRWSSSWRWSRPRLLRSCVRAGRNDGAARPSARVS